jgi:beta-lactamase regulating signal transducer with metallopeptidase domain
VAPPIAMLAVRWSPTDTAQDKHAVLVVGVLAAMVVIVGSIMTRPITDHEGLWIFPAGIWRLYWAPVLLAGSLVFFAVHAWGGLIVWLHCRRGRAPEPGIRHKVNTAADQLGMLRPPRVVVSRFCTSPYATLWGFGTIVVPSGFASEPDADQSAMLLHEAAHVARGDCLTNTLCQLGGVLMWWNPFYWITMREIALQREIACDAAVLARHRNEARYADLLVRVARRVSMLTTMSFASAPMATKSTLRSRLEAIGSLGTRCHYTDFEVTPMSRSSMMLAVACITVAVLVMESVGHVFFREAFHEIINESTVY